MNKKHYTGYYSHSKRIFGKNIEKLEYEFLKSKFNENIICPNLHLENFATMEPYLEIIKKVYYLFVTDYEGYLGRGGYEECAFALEEFIPVYLLRTRGDKMEFELVTDVFKIRDNNLIEYGEIVSKEVYQNQLPFL